MYASVCRYAADRAHHTHFNANVLVIIGALLSCSAMPGAHASVSGACAPCGGAANSHNYY